MKITKETLAEMQSVDIRTVDINSLKDINDVVIDESLSKEERMIRFIKQIQNPYLYRYGCMIVKITYSDTDRTLEDVLKSYIASLC